LVYNSSESKTQAGYALVGQRTYLEKMPWDNKTKLS
jgi:hypothetical protein